MVYQEGCLCNKILSYLSKIYNNYQNQNENRRIYFKNTETVISMNAQELAKQAGSSPAAIIRFCHSMDVNGFTELKLYYLQILAK